MKKHSDNEFGFVGAYYKDSCAFTGARKLYPAIGRMDPMGNIISAHYYVLNANNCSNVGVDLEITNTNEVIAWGGDAMFFALKIDAAGIPLWAKRFGYIGGFQFIKELPGGDLLAGINMSGAGAVVARLDMDGNSLWCKSYFRPRGMVHDAVIESDSAFVITGYTDSIASTNVFEPPPPEYHPKLFMMKLNGSGDVQWCRGYDSDPYLWYARRGSSVVRTLDGKYAVLANLGVEGYNLHFRPFLMKTDLNGDTLWTRSAGVTGYTYDTSDLLACADGGFAYSGQGWGLGMYIFKTDSLGYLPCHNKRHEVQLSYLFPTDSSFTLASVDGATVHPAFVNDTVYDPVVVTEGCIAVTVPDSGDPHRSQVYPNPNTGRFTVEFAEPIVAENYYSVYDALGKMLYQRSLPIGATMQEIDLSLYGKGTYAIKVSSPGGVSYERVVLE